MRNMVVRCWLRACSAPLPRRRGRTQARYDRRPGCLLRHGRPGRRGPRRDRISVTASSPGRGLLYLELVKAKKIKKLACADPIPTLAEAREAFVAWANANPGASFGRTDRRLLAGDDRQLPLLEIGRARSGALRDVARPRSFLPAWPPWPWLRPVARSTARPAAAPAPAPPSAPRPVPPSACCRATFSPVP